MSNVAPLGQKNCADRGCRDGAAVRHLWNQVDTFLSCIQLERLTSNEMARVLRIFDTANACIELVLSDLRENPAINQLIGQSLEIKARIETAREKVAGLTPAPATRSA